MQYHYSTIVLSGQKNFPQSGYITTIKKFHAHFHFNIIEVDKVYHHDTSPHSPPPPLHSNILIEFHYPSQYQH